MKKPVPKRKREPVDPAKAEELARKTFQKNAETCLKPLQIIGEFEYISQQKPGNIYGIAKHF
jgi:hypothetical protein